MSPELAAVAISVVVLIVNGVGALLNDRRYTTVCERLARIETKLEIQHKEK